MKNFSAAKALALAICLSLPSSSFAANFGRSAPMRASAGAAVYAGELRVLGPELRRATSLYFRPGITAQDSLAQMRGAAAAGPSAKHAGALALIARAALFSPEIAGSALSKAGIAPELVARVTAAATSLNRAAVNDAEFAAELAQAREELEAPAAAKARGRLPQMLAHLSGAFSSNRAEAQPGLIPAAAGSRGSGHQPDAPRPGGLQKPPPIPESEAARIAAGEAAKTAEPRVASSRKVSELIALAKTDKAAAVAAAESVLADKKENRLEVRMSALRVVAEHAGAAAVDVFMTQVKNDRNNWYLRREAMRGLGARASAIEGEAREAALAALRQAYSSTNDSVRLMAAWAIRQFGVDPGVEPRVGSDALKGTSDATQQVDAPKPGQKAGKPAAPARRSETPILLKVLFGLAIGFGVIKVLDYVLTNSGPGMQMIVGALVFVTLIALLGRRMGGAGNANAVRTQISQTTKRLQQTTTKFTDVAGIDDAVDEIHEIVDYLRDPMKYLRLGAVMPRGVLLEGPPGTGKTLLAKALATESGANFISVSASDFVEMFVGVGASRVRTLFDEAKKNKPSIIYIDELDAVAKRRDGGGLAGNDEREQTLNAILAEMDGFGSGDGVIVLASTNRSDVLDSAITRPGRFDRKIHVGFPDVLGREAILQVHARTRRLGADADLQFIAQRTVGLSGAFLKNIVNEAALLAARRGGDSISQADLNEGVDRNTVGAKRNLFIPAEVKMRIARHEVGHAITMLRTSGKTPNRVTVVPHGAFALGWAEPSGEDSQYLHTEQELSDTLVTLLGGIAAERVYYGGSSTGPDNDLERATNVARLMVQRWGMSRKLGFAQTASDQQGPFAPRLISEQTAREVDEEVKRLLDEAYAKAEAFINAERKAFDGIVEELLARETITGEDIQRIAGERK